LENGTSAFHLTGKDTRAEDFLEEKKREEASATPLANGA
jgi:hypothetical protein